MGNESLEFLDCVSERKSLNVSERKRINTRACALSFYCDFFFSFFFFHFFPSVLMISL